MDIEKLLHALNNDNNEAIVDLDYAKIAKAISDRLAKGAIGLHENVKKVVWPTWTEFNAAGFLECRVLYYECVLASLKAAIFQDFKD